MATQPLETAIASAYVDESRFERIDGKLTERPVPGATHSDIQFNVTILLKAYAAATGATCRQEWSLTQPEFADADNPNFMTADVLLSLPGPYRQTKSGHLLPPALLAVEILSQGQDGLIQKAQRFIDWGVEHCWIINPETRVCLEYHGGNEPIIARDVLRAGDVELSVADVFEGLL